ncbi:MAG TPA: acyltransferase [Polyangiaceae bacterium]|jgi:peptidoglycan/LPS O-acetylase OafA/YrhL|nr:acyltransferase [Polyangiaceae bacterium]
MSSTLAEAPSQPERAPRVDALTGLRFLAALAVVLSHVGPPPGAGPILTTFVGSCYGGVTIFFVLSGFVLAHNYFDRYAKRPNLRLLRSFFVARLARVYPLYLVWLSWVALGVLPKLKLHEREVLWTHVLALQAWSPSLKDAFGFNSPGWSISVEFFLYACFPPLVLLLAPITRRIRWTWLALAVVALAMIGAAAYFHFSGRALLPYENPDSAHRWLYRHPATRLGDFMLGILAARLVRLREPPAELSASALAAASLLVLLGLMSWPSHFKTAPSWDVSFALPAACLIFALASAPHAALARLLSSKPLLLLGEASYALYICHYTLLKLLGLKRTPTAYWLPTCALSIGLVIALSVGLHVTLEKPCRSFLRWLLDPAARVKARQREPQLAPAPEVS